MFNITYNNQNPSNFDAWLATIPQLTHSAINRTRQAIPKRNGDLLMNDMSRSNAYWSCMIHIRKTNYLKSIRGARHWLSGEGILRLTDDAYYEVEQVTHTEEVIKDLTYGRLTVSFEVYPYEFLDSGDTMITSYSSITNDHDVSLPIYEITGAGSGKLTVNGAEMSYTSEHKLVIDTRRMIAYDEYNGTKTDANNKISGDYSKLCLKHGTNSISITGGTTLRVQPKWGYAI